MSRPFRALLPIAPIGVALLLATIAAPRRAIADPADEDIREKAERCATRLFTVMVGEGATAEALASTNPQASFDVLTKDNRFYERFSRFVNSQFNNTPGTIPAEDASYYLTKYVVSNGKPWTEMFVGKYDVASTDGKNANAEAAVTDDPNGLGYFRSRAWMVRYAGNESAGIRISTAYRMMQNTIGLKLSATTNAPDVDVSAGGRKAPQCAGCHYDPWFALDAVASVLGTRQGTGDNTKFTAPAGGSKQLLGGLSISNDADLVNALVTNEAFDVNACRLAYTYLYGRAENSCEGPVFDTCVAAFKKDKRITSALAAIATDPTFCE